jgi:iron complex transport system permease protein
MQRTKRGIRILIIAFLLIASCVLHLFSGQFDLTLTDYYAALVDFDVNNQFQLIAREIRIPRLLAALLSGAALSISGLIMQTLFRNPLAGPYVLGINSGASLMVALLTLTGSTFFISQLGIVSASLIGGIATGMIILLLSTRITSSVSLLLIGLMIASFSSAVISVLQSLGSESGLKQFTMWTLGSLQHVSFDQLGGLTLLILLGIGGSLLAAKPLNVLLLGEDAAQLLGVNVKLIRVVLIGISILLASVITAYCGPIAFVGLAIPNVTRMVFNTQNHLTLIIGSALFGSLFLVLVDSLSQIAEPVFILPINAITSFIGAPFVILILLKRIK